MKHADKYSDESPGQLVSVEIDGAEIAAFVPDSLPRNPPNIGPELLDSVGECAYNLGELYTVHRETEAPIGEPLLRTEAIASSRIEGIQTSLSSTYADRTETTNSVENSDATKYVDDYLEALQYGLEYLDENNNEFTPELICELHTRVMRESDVEVGKFRSVQNCIGTRRRIVYVPPPPKEVSSLMSNLCSYLNSSHTEYPPHIRAAIAHYQFESIHPFVDGNGRVGRLLATLQLSTELEHPYESLLVSPPLFKRRQKYYSGLRAVSSNNDWDTWLRYFVSQIGTQAAETTDALLKLDSHYEHYHSLYADSRSPNIDGLLDCLFSSPYFTTQTVAKELDVTVQTAENLINKLQNDNIVEKYTGNLFCAREVASTIENLYTQNRISTQHYSI